MAIYKKVNDLEGIDFLPGYPEIIISTIREMIELGAVVIVGEHNSVTVTIPESVSYLIVAKITALGYFVYPNVENLDISEEPDGSLIIHPYP